VLIDEHADADPGHVETIEKVMNSMFNRLVDRMRFTQFNHTFGHGRHDIGVTISNLDQSLAESKFLFEQIKKKIKLNIFITNQERLSPTR
jgi:hypothetical protein